MEFIEAIEVPPVLIAVATPAKSRNVGTIVRSASACGAKMLVIVGNNRVGFHGSFGSNTRITILHFSTWSEATAFLKSKRSCVHFYGLAPPGCEHASAQPLKKFAFPVLQEGHSACFVVGAPNQPLSEEILDFLDVPVKVEFPNPVFARRLQFEEVLAIAIHHYCASMKREDGSAVFLPHGWNGEKFIKDEVPAGMRQSGNRGMSVSQIMQRSQRNKVASASDDGADLALMGSLLGGSSAAGIGDY